MKVFPILAALAALLLTACTDNEEEKANASIQIIQPSGSAYLMVFSVGEPVCLAEALQKKSGNVASTPQIEIVILDSVSNLNLLVAGNREGQIFDQEEATFLAATVTITGTSSSRILGRYRLTDTTGINTSNQTTRFNALRCPEVQY